MFERALEGICGKIRSKNSIDLSSFFLFFPFFAPLLMARLTKEEREFFCYLENCSFENLTGTEVR
jgi:hypothetical protein